jgi:hypothetical protein
MLFPLRQFASRSESSARVCKHLAVANSQCLDPTLLAERNTDEIAELNKLRLAEMFVQPRPQSIVRKIRVPHNRARPQQRRFFPLAEFVRRFKLQQFQIFFFCQPSLSRPDRALVPSIIATDGLRNVYAAQFFHFMRANPVAEHRIPRPRKRSQNIGNMRANQLAFRTRRAMQPRVFDVSGKLRLAQRFGIRITDSRHVSPASQIKAPENCAYPQSLRAKLTGVKQIFAIRAGCAAP